jgi:hypothetical protein
LKDSKRHGQGSYMYANGDEYSGEWKVGNRDGMMTNVMAKANARMLMEASILAKGQMTSSTSWQRQLSGKGQWRRVLFGWRDRNTWLSSTSNGDATTIHTDIITC